MNKEFAKKLAEIKGWTVEKVETINEVTNSTEVYNTFSNIEGIPNFDNVDWLRSISKGVEGFDEKFDRLVELWGKNVIYTIALESISESPKGAEIIKTLNRLLPSELQLKQCKTFGKNCHEMLDILYEMGVKSPEDISKAIDSIKHEYQFSGRGRMDAADLDLNQKSLLSAFEDIKKVVDMAYKYHMVSNEFSGLTL